MNRPLPEYQFLLALAAGVAVITILAGSPVGYFTFLLLLLFSGIVILTRTFEDRGVYLVCSGAPLVAACGMVNLWAGLFAACMITGIVCRAFGLLESREDLRPFALFCGSAFLVALIIQLSNHVLLPLLVLAVIMIIILSVQSVRWYQFKKFCTGA
jgi:hypothetical protein